MQNNYYKAIISQLRARSVEATLGVLGLKSDPLRKFLKLQLSEESSRASNILANPVFEAVFPWTPASKSLQELVGSVLEASLVSAMDSPPAELKEQAFKKEFKPYTHQLKSWQFLSESKPKSLVVTSGTGSGKTECFMVPILNDLAKQVQTHKRLEGVQALFVYPLNALINSQRERISAWTHAYQGKIRFCLYNGNTPEIVNAHERSAHTNEVLSRQDLRNSPPPILITNPTMLEYMLIRNQDKPIIDKSQGKLRYIVLDEAHTYIGSQAAELSLLIRRVLHAFNVKSEDLRFIATSATVGAGEEAKNALKQYLANLAGIDAANIEIIDGQRNIPVLPDIKDPFHGSPSDIHAVKDYQEKRRLLMSSPVARRLRNQLIEKPYTKTLQDLSAHLFEANSESVSAQELNTLEWLDLCSDPDITDPKESFLPLRGHLFHRVLHGLWTCVDSNCTAKESTHLNDPTWKFGKVFTHQRLTCECGAPIFELVSCNECGTIHLQAYQSGGKIIQAQKEQVDEFSLEIEEGYDDDGGVEDNIPSNKLIIAPQESNSTSLFYLSKEGVLDGIGGSGISVYIDNHDLACSGCGHKGGGRSAAYRHAYLGTPFYISNIVPTLLEHCPDGKNEPLSRPMRGRSLITFTDSRQGTARISAKMQQDAERYRTRGLVYNTVTERDNSEKIKNLEEEIIDLEKVASLAPAIRNVITQKQNEIQSLAEAVISWDELVMRLQNNSDINMHMLDYYRDLNPGLFDSATVLTKILLVREFNRRPKRANSPETLGLVAVTYNGLDKISEAPKEWINRGLCFSDWKDFLKIILDFYVRDGVFINIPSGWLNWLGGKFTPKYLLSPNSTEGQDKKHRRWPQYESHRGIRQHKLLRLLAHVLGLDIEAPSKEEVDILNELMARAWTAITASSGILTSNAGNFQLELSKLQFKPISKAWLCPITLRVLDTTLCGYTPYLPIGAKLQEYKCEALTIPVKPNLPAQSYEESVKEVRDWVGSNEQIKILREKGVWTNQNDNIVEGGTYFRSAEHSAQQPARRLKLYEKKFKEGRLNILSCSTTMEMGVDIGGLSMVCNNNVPPHPANYLQRAGRAGRRNETRSLSLTICKDNPHDQAVFRNPLWAFVTQLKQPYITLSSERIVQRHINALLLGHMLNVEIPNLQTNAILLKCGWFFTKEEKRLSVCEKMTFWLEEMKSSSMNQRLKEGINSIIAKSVLKDCAIAQLLGNSAKLLKKISEKWNTEYELLQEELNEAAEAPERDPYKRRVQKDIDRHKEEYLLSELVSGGFLPGYGFPTGIAPFNPYNIGDFQRPSRTSEEREDNLQRYKEKPSRNLAMALREYAPGADVVLDGLVYRSEGLSLNWHVPDDDAGVVEIQKIRQAWRCGKCGSSGTASSAFNNQCTNCENIISPSLNRNDGKIDFIQPTGFSTGFYSSPTNDISTQIYIPSEEPWIDAGGPLRTLPNASLGFYKVNSEGNIFYYSSGEFGNGYALCLGCGKAESMKEDGSDPSMVVGHKKLRGRINGQGSTNCEAAPNKIKRNIHLGYEDKTDIFELYLKHPETNEFIYEESNQRAANLTLCWTLAIALRYGLATSLGINTEELGVAVKPARIDQDPRPVYSICLYDTNGGGAGFASSAPQYLGEMFKLAKSYLNCKAGCEDACEHCLLQHDTRKVAQYLDRKVSSEYLNDDFLSCIQLPKEDMLLGDLSVFCAESFYIEIDLAAKRTTDELLIYLNGPTQEWDIAASSLKAKLPAYASTFNKVKVIMAKDSLDSLDADQKRDLFGFASVNEACEIHIVERIPELQNGKGIILAQIKSENAYLTFATKVLDASILNEKWGDTADGLLVKAVVADLALSSRVISKSDLLPVLASGDQEVRVTTELDGELSTFGERFWRLLEEKIPGLKSDLDSRTLRKVIYTDPYLASPLTVLLVSRILSSLVNRYPKHQGKADLNIITLMSNEYYRPTSWRAIFSNWFEQEKESRREFMDRVFSAGFNSCKSYLIGERIEISHARILELHFTEGQSISLRLDQGVGYWNRVHGKTNFPFDDTVENQLNWVEEDGLKRSIWSSKELPTYIFKSSGGNLQYDIEHLAGVVV